MLITLDDIRQAQERLRGVTLHTPLVQFDHGLHLKPESLQPIRSFKLRGAYNRIAALSDEERANGVIAYSSGNHAQGVAYAARQFGIPAVIVMPANAPKVKIEATRSYEAQVVLYDPATEKREEVAAKLSAGKSWTLVPPFDDPYVIAGQGTIGAEIAQDAPDVDLVIVPIGGGGLISGVATAIKIINPNAKVIGVEPELAADAQQSFRSGTIQSLTTEQTARTIADGVRTLHLSERTFAHIQHYVDDILTVSESTIYEAARQLLLRGKLLIEPSGVLPYAAWLQHRDLIPRAKKAVLVLSGGNADGDFLRTLIS
jgi:threo-3-hydroxy-L-aspartate ammonia-lyase